MLRRRKRGLFISSLAALCIPEVALFCYLGRRSLFGWSPDPGWLALFTLLMLLLGLSLFSTWLWHGVGPGNQRLGESAALPLLFLSCGLSTFLIMTPWFRLLLSFFTPAGTESLLLWAFALAISWIVSPFLALWMLSVGRSFRSDRL
jgi:hypothetical protein